MVGWSGRGRALTGWLIRPSRRCRRQCRCLWRCPRRRDTVFLKGATRRRASHHMSVRKRRDRGRIERGRHRRGWHLPRVYREQGENRPKRRRAQDALTVQPIRFCLRVKLCLLPIRTILPITIHRHRVLLTTTTLATATATLHSTRNGYRTLGDRIMRASPSYTC